MQHNVTFFLKEPRANHETLIYAYLHFGGKQVKLSTGLKIHPKQWSPAKQRVRRGALLEMPINERLDRIGVTLSKIFLDLRNEWILPTPDLIKNRFYTLAQPTTRKERNVLTCFDDYIDSLTGKMQPGTITNYKTTRKHLASFASTYPSKLTFDSMDRTFFAAFTRYLLTTADLGNNGVWNVTKNLKAFLRNAERTGLTTATHYREFRVTKFERPVIALTQEELACLENLDLSDNPRLQRVRDQFLIECYTGVRYSDLAKITPEQIQKGKISIVTKKTCDAITIPIIPAAREILMRCRDLTSRVITNQRMNAYLKELAELAELNTPCTLVSYKGAERIETTLPKHKIISTHTGRRTFVTISLERGMRPETVMKITGHKDMKSFMRYVQVTNSVATRELVEAWTLKEP